MLRTEESHADRARLLLVHEDKGYVTILSKRMARRQIDVVPAFSGNVALQLLREQDFDVAILDPKLEDMDGRQLLKLVRIMDPQLPVIMFAALDSERGLGEEKEAGAFASLPKLCDFDDLLQKVREALSARR